MPKCTRTCLVTGATGAIGKEICRVLREAGYSIVGLARVRPDWWEGEFIACDLADDLSLERACTATTSLGSLGALVNAAGQARSDSLVDLEMGTIRHMFSVNTFAPALLARHCASQMM